MGSACVNLVTPKGGVATGYEALWFRADYLLWQRTGSDLPPLVISSPDGTPLDSSTVVIGNQEVNDGWRSGILIEGGFWLNPSTGWAIAGDYFDAGRDSFGFSGGLSTDQFLARPFFNAATDLQSAFLVDGPGEFAGTVNVSAYDDFEGAGAAMQRALWERGNACMDGGFARLSLLGGYRFYHHDSRLVITEDSTAVTGNTSMAVAGTRRLVQDRFFGENDFHGFEIGLQARVQRRRWWYEGLAVVALGTNRRVVSVDGNTQSIPPNPVGDPPLFVGGLLTAFGKNIGVRADNEGNAIPRFRLGAGWQATEKLGLRAGYSVVIWDGVVYAADHLPPGLAVDPNNLPDGNGGGGPEPVFPGIRDSTMVAHGLDLGLELSF